MDKNITVFEFGEITLNVLKEKFGEKVAKTAFRQLKSLILPRTAEAEDVEKFNEYGELKDASVCMTFCGDKICVKNYVGTISLPCGVTVEVLPKISDASSKEEARKLVIEMLKVCGVISYKSFQNAKLSVASLNLFEVYVRLFLNEVQILCKKGLRAGYVSYEDNENFLKGKLKFSEHIKRNFAHKEKFYVQYDLFSFDRAENRLIKTALKYLLNKSADEANRKDIRKYLLLFDEISLSENTELDFAKCGTGREVKDYEQVIKLCRVFLHKKSFTMYSGTSDVVALMFPMETLFERYIPRQMENAICGGWTLHAQSKGKYLFDGKRFSLRPDILLINSEKSKENSAGEKQKIIVDTKWKKLYCNKNHYGISQADMYQMYAYHKRYKNVEKVVLLYPYYKEIEQIKIEPFEIAEDGVLIYIAFFNLGEYIKNKNFKDCITGADGFINLLPLKG